MVASTPGISLLGFQLFGRERWGIRACMPGLLMVAVVLALTRSSRSLLVVFENGWNDWTRFVYALFGMMPLVNFMFIIFLPALIGLYHHFNQPENRAAP